MRVAIAGGSIGGLFAAALLAKQGHDVSIFERSRSGLSGRGAGLVAQEDVFTLLGLLGRSDVALVGVTARARITLDRSGTIIHRDPHPQMQISWDALYGAVLEQIPSGSLHLGRTVTAAGSAGDQGWVQLDDGTRIEADLIIGADGIASRVRRCIATASTAAPAYAGYAAWRFLLLESLLPRAAAVTLSEQFAFYHMKGGQVLGYLVPGPEGQTKVGERRYNCVWYRDTPDLTNFLTDRTGLAHAYSLPRGSVSDERRAAVIDDACKLLPPPFALVVAAEPQPFAQAIFDFETPKMTDGRLVLIGDAAFVARPHTAMGVAKVAGDVMALAELLGGATVSEALVLYERQRSRFGRSVVDYGRRLGASLRS